MTQLTKHPKPRASFSELRLGQRGDLTDVLQLVFQAYFADGQCQLGARGAVHADAVGEGSLLDLLGGSILVVNALPVAGLQHLFGGREGVGDELDVWEKYSKFSGGILAQLT